jgi:hypothetical protein
LEIYNETIWDLIAEPLNSPNIGNGPNQQHN